MVFLTFKEREFLTLVTVSSIPPLTCYGSGATVEASREEAASNALKPLLQLGLDRTNKLKPFEESQAALQGKYWTCSVKTANLHVFSFYNGTDQYF